MTEEQQALLNKAGKSLAAANLLVSQGYPDFAVSRAYYAMFYIATAFLLGEGLTFSKHSAVIAKFGQYFVKTGAVPAKFHRYLITAENSRIVGDYDTGPGLTQTDAATQIARAEEFLDFAAQNIGKTD